MEFAFVSFRLPCSLRLGIVFFWNKCCLLAGFLCSCQKWAMECGVAISLPFAAFPRQAYSLPFLILGCSWLLPGAVSLPFLVFGFRCHFGTVPVSGLSQSASRPSVFCRSHCCSVLRCCSWPAVWRGNSHCNSLARRN